MLLNLIYICGSEPPSVLLVSFQNLLRVWCGMIVLFLQASGVLQKRALCTIIWPDGGTKSRVWREMEQHFAPLCRIQQIYIPSVMSMSATKNALNKCTIPSRNQELLPQLA